MGFRRLFSSIEVAWLFALVCPRIWTLFVIKPLYSVSESCFALFYAAEAVTAALAGIAIARRSIVGTDRPPIRKTDTVTTPAPVGVLMCLPTLMFALPPCAGNAMLTIVASVLAGATMAWCYLQCAQLYSLLGEREAVFFVLVSFALGAALRFPIELIPTQIAAVVVAPLPLVCLYMCKRGRGFIAGYVSGPMDSAPAAQTRPVSLRSLAPYIVLLLEYGLILGMFQVSLPAEQDDLTVIVIGMIVKVALPLALLTFFLLFSKHLDLGLICQISMLLVFTALMLIIAFFEGGQLPIAGMASDYGRNIFNFVLISVLAVMASKDGRHAFVVFGIGWAMLPAMECVGMMSARALSPLASDDATGMAVLYILVASTVVALAFGMRLNQDARLFSPIPRDQDSFRKFERREDNLRTIGSSCGLTERESEIMVLICKGRSKRYIAEHLFISENTVRTHTRKIYDKMHVHSREELLDLFDSTSCLSS